MKYTFTLMLVIVFMITSCSRSCSRSISFDLGKKITENSKSWAGENSSECTTSVNALENIYKTTANAVFSNPSEPRLSINVDLETDQGQYTIAITETEFQVFHDLTQTKSFRLTKAEYIGNEEAGYMTLAYQAMIDDEKTTVHIPFVLAGDTYVLASHQQSS